MTESFFDRKHAAILNLLILLMSSIALAGSGERPVRTASGPFAVAGSPDSYSVAWFEDAGEIQTLWLQVDREPEYTRLYLVAGKVERKSGLFVDMNHTKVVMAWHNSGGWNIGHLDPRVENDKLRSFPFPDPGRLLGLALNEDGTGMVAILQNEANGTSRIVEIDLENEAVKTLMTIHEAMVSVAVHTMADRTAVAWTDAEGGLTLEILDRSGPVSSGRKLNVFPVADARPRIGQFRDTMIITWNERLPDDKPAARTAGFSMDGTFTLLDTGEINGDAPSGRIVPSLGDGRLVLQQWDGQPSVASLQMLDGRLDPSCGPVMEDSRLPVNSWLLGGADDALLFRSRETEDGHLSLTSQTMQCDYGTSMAGAGGTEAFTDGAKILGGSEDPCDGFDNDGDGILDNGCDLVCDAPEVAIGPLDFVDGAWESYNPVIVRAGSEYGVAFVDSRGAYPGIFFARMDEAGNKIYERRITTDNHSAYDPTLVWTGSQYGLAWEDFSAGRYEIFLKILNSDGSGSPPSTAPVQVTDPCPGCGYYGGLDPSIAWSGSEFGVAFHSNRNAQNDIFFARLQSDGTKIGADQVVNAGGGDQTPTLAWADVQWGVAWRHTLSNGNNEIFFRRIDSLGNPYGTVFTITNAAGYSGAPSLVWAGNQYGLSWQDDRSGGSEIYFCLLRSTGQRLSTDIRITNSSGGAYFPSLVWTGEEFSMSWNDTRGGNQDVYTARVSAGAVKQGGDLRISAPPAVAGMTSIAWSGTGQVVVWEDIDDGVWGVHTAFVRCCDDMDGDGYTECAGDPNDHDAGSYPGGPDACDGRDNNGDGVVDETCDGSCSSPTSPGEVLVSNAGANPGNARITWSGAEFGVAWTGPWFRRLDSSGQPIGPAVSITAGYSADALVWTGTEYGLLTRDSSASHLVRLDAAGTLIGTTSFDVMEYPTMVWNGSEYGVVTDDFLFYRIDAAGNQIGQSVDLGLGSFFSNVDLVWNGTGYALVWDGVHFRRFNADGSLIGATITLSTDVASNAPSIVWTGSEYGVVWQYGNFPTGQDGVKFVRLDANGVIQGGETTVTLSTRYTNAPVIRWTGEEYLVAWQDDRSFWDRIGFQRLSATGAVLSSSPSWYVSGGTEVDIRTPAMVFNGKDFGVIARYDYLAAQPSEVWFKLFECCNQNNDGDPYRRCSDCDDWNAAVYPGALQVCDGLNNDCDDPAWPLPDGTNEVDIDGDTQSECAGDCDETDVTVYTGAPELCDFQDNNCDTVVDEGFPIPGASDFVLWDNDKETMEWTVVEFADRYDVVRGRLDILTGSGGDFREAIDTCLVDDHGDTTLNDREPLPVGYGFYYLVRAEAACKTGTYDSRGEGLVQKRDDEIAESTSSCP